MISANNRAFMTAINQVQNRLNGLDSSTGRATNNISNNFSKLGSLIGKALAIGAIYKFGKACTEAGSDVAEVQNVVDVTFGSMAETINNFAESAKSQFGLSVLQAKQFTGTMGAMLKSSGITGQAITDMSTKIAGLTGDMASFYNISQEMAFEKIRSGISGETEPLKQLGINMSVANLEAYAMSQGINKAYKDMSQAEQTLLRYNYLLSVTGDAQGDFARTSDSWANQVRLLSINFSSLKANIGQALIAVLQPTLKAINLIMEKLVQMSSVFAQVVAAITGGTVVGGSMGGIADESITTGIDDTTGAMQGLGDTTDGVGKKADKTKKKLEKLAGFDQINKLSKDNDDSGSGGSSGGSGGGVGSVAKAIPGKQIEELANKYKNLLAELLSPLKDAWNNYGPWFLDKWDYFKKSFGFSCEALSNFLKSVWRNGGKEFVQHLAEIGIAIGGVALQIGGDILIALGNLWNHLNPDSNPYTKKFIKAMNSLAIAVRDFIISAGNWFGKFLNLGGQAFINCIGDICVLVGTTLAEIFADAIRFVTNFMNSWAGTALIGTCAITLNIVAGAIKAVAIVIEKCHGVLEALIVAWGIWKVSCLATSASDLLITDNSIARLYSSLSGLTAQILANITQCVAWYKTLAINCVNGIKSFATALITTGRAKMVQFSTAIKNCASNLLSWAKVIIMHPIDALKYLVASLKYSISQLVLQAKELALNALQWVKNTASLIAHKAALIATTAAEKGLALAQTALNLVMEACPIILLITGIAALSVAIVKIGEKFGWWKAIMETISPVLDWIGEKLSGLWDGIKSFFGWDADVECKDNIEEIGTTAQETASTTDSAFGTMSSNVNQYLDSINFNATKLASQFDEATKACEEKISMLSGNAQKYLQALENGDAETLSQMAGNRDIYINETKQAYSDMTNEEKAMFYQKYGELKGVNDDFLNYEGLSYAERIARNTAYIQRIQQDDSLSYEQKKQRISEFEQAFNSSLDGEVQKLKDINAQKQAQLDELTSYRGTKTIEQQTQEDTLRSTIEQNQAIIDSLVNKSADFKATTNEEANNRIISANEQARQSEEEAYQKTADTCEQSMERVNTSVDNAEENIKSFSDVASEVGNSISSAFDGIGNKIGGEFTRASVTISASLSKINNDVTNRSNVVKSTIQTVFNSISTTINTTLNNTLSRVQSAMMSIMSAVSGMANSVNSSVNNMNGNITNVFANIEHLSYANFSSARNNVNICMDDMVRKVQGAIDTMQRAFSNFNGTLKIKIPHIETNFDSMPIGDGGNVQIPKFKVNYFAKGGVVSKATPAIFGEAGREAVIPLERNTGAIDAISSAIGSRIVNSIGGFSSSNDNRPLYLSVQIGDGDIVTKVIDNINTMTESTGECPIKI